MKTKLSKADYMRRYRRVHPEYRKRNIQISKARIRALEALARAHPLEFGRLMRNELDVLEAETTPT